jgi:prepilin-type N-terminal cleavage/methylation domain-containing protein
MQQRKGFTLVELLVAMALIVFMMLILSEAFSTALDSFRRIKAIGDMNARLRIASGILRRDLQADHFEGKRRLSNTTFWTPGPPREGFFRIWQGSAAVSEGTDSYGIPSARATNHILHFTVKLRGNDWQDFLAAKVPTGSPLLSLGNGDSRFQNGTDFNSQWFEVVYFLRRNGNSADATPLYALYRRQRLIMPETPGLHDLNWGANRVAVSELPNYLEVSCKANPQDPGFLYFNTPTDVTIPQRRFGADPSQSFNLAANQWPGLPTVRNVPSEGILPNDPRTWTYPTLGEENPALEGNDLLLPDVISFEVKIATSSISDFVDLPTSSTNDMFRDQAASGPAPRFRPHVFDTWTRVVDGYYFDSTGRSLDYSRWRESTIRAPSTTFNPLHAPNYSTIFALKITLRVWDVKTLQARQITIIQDL